MCFGFNVLLPKHAKSSLKLQNTRNIVNIENIRMEQNEGQLYSVGYISLSSLKFVSYVKWSYVYAMITIVRESKRNYWSRHFKKRYSYDIKSCNAFCRQIRVARKVLLLCILLELFSINLHVVLKCFILFKWRFG